MFFLAKPLLCISFLFVILISCLHPSSPSLTPTQAIPSPPSPRRPHPPLPLIISILRSLSSPAQTRLAAPHLHVHILPPCTNLSITIPFSRLTLSTHVFPLPTHLTASPAHQTSPSPISVSPLSPSPEADPCIPFSFSFHHSLEDHPIPHLYVSLGISLSVPPPLSLQHLPGTNILGLYRFPYRNGENRLAGEEGRVFVALLVRLGRILVRFRRISLLQNKGRGKEKKMLGFRTIMQFLLVAMILQIVACTEFFKPFNVSYDHRALIINGKCRMLISYGIHHYPRATPEMWLDMISKNKEGGADLIQTYAFWNGHEPIQRIRRYCVKEFI